MIVVADSGPLHYLILLDYTELLRRFYGRVVVPDLGERAAIALAATLRADLLLIDDAAERAEARRRNLRVTETLGVLEPGRSRVS
jgi:predicted nucleic acid-binding protein